VKSVVYFQTKEVLVQLKDIIQWQTRSGDKITVGDVVITPQSQALIVRWPYGGLVWNRPVALLVDWGDRAEHIPIVDVTRRVQLALWGLSLIFTLVVFLFALKGEQK
jgi:hypothetical protein